MTDQTSKNVQTNNNPSLYWVLVLSWFGVLILTSGILLDWQISSLDEVSPPRQIILAVLIIWFVSSIHIIKFNRTAGLLGLQMPISNIKAGPILAPWGLTTILDYPADIQPRQFPGNAEKVFKGDDNMPLPKGMFRPLRLTTGKPDKGCDDILDIQASVEVLFYLRVRINDALKFHLRYGDMEGFWSQIRDSGQKILASEFSQAKGLGKLIESYPGIMLTLNKKYTELASAGGVEVIESGLDSPDMSKKLSEALRNLGSARSEAEQTHIKILKEGIAKAESEGLLIKAISEALTGADPSAKAAYVGSKVLSDKTTVLGTEGITQILGLAKIINKKED